MLGSTRHCDDYNALIFCAVSEKDYPTSCSRTKEEVWRATGISRYNCFKGNPTENLWKLKLRVPRRGQQILQFKTVRVEDWAKITRVTSFSIQEPSWVLNSIKYISVSLFNNFSQFKCSKTGLELFQRLKVWLRTARKRTVELVSR